MRKIFIDCGCHKGQSIIEAQRKFGNDIEIFGFEALPILAYSLQQQYKNNIFVNVDWKAVWSSNSELDIHAPTKGASWSSSAYKRWEYSFTHKVPSIDLSQWIQDNFDKNDYIILKLDVEGAEYEVLSKMIDDGTVDYINEFYGEWYDNKIDNLPKDKIQKIKEYSHSSDRKFHIWETTWSPESTPGMVGFPKHLDKDQKWGQVNPYQKITFVLPSRNNLEFLKLAVESIRGLTEDDSPHQILILDDASSDGTKEWVEMMQKFDKDLTLYHNPGPDRIGIVGMFDKGIEMATTDIIFAFHADMVASKDLDKNILKHLTPGSVISATRVEPPLHPSGPEKIIYDFGQEAEDFVIEAWLSKSEELKENKVTEGIFAPWCMYKSDYIAVGGHDDLFAPQSKEDSDLFNRFVLNGYGVYQSWDALVYHFTSRGSRFNKHAGGGPGKDSDEWKFTTTRNARNFIRKWGHFVKHDQLMNPIIPPRYNTTFIVNGPMNDVLLNYFEPWADRLLYKDTTGITDRYIQSELANSNLPPDYFQSKLMPQDRDTSVEEITAMIDNSKDGDKQLWDVLVMFDTAKLSDTDVNYLQNIAEFISDDDVETGYWYEIGNINIFVQLKQDLRPSLIKA